MSQPKRYLITSALPYANGALHLGHLAGAYLPADVYARYLRALGKDVVWVCGSDEHGAAITIRAKKEGISPRDIIDKYHHLNKDTFAKLGISFDYYHRTSAPLHYETAQDFFLKLYEKGGEFDEKVSEQYYDEEYHQFLADRFITGTCPKCGYEEAYGDQCESCGSDLSPLDLVNPVSTLSGNTPQLKETKHWYFRLDKHEVWLKDWIQNGMLDGVQHHDPKKWKKHVLGQCLSWLDNGLQPRSITRDLDWGIPVPLEGAEGKVLYVWFDAPIGYISSTKQWAKENGKDWEPYWKSEDTEIINFIGKDNIVFHCIVFPSILKAYGEYQLPKNVPANQFLNFEGRKFSKSKNWGIEQHEYLEDFKDFPNKEDALRFALLRNLPENRDSDFKWDDFIDAHDKDLADNIGNFVNRVLVLTNKYYEGVVPEVTESIVEVLKPVADRVSEFQRHIERFQFKQALAEVLAISSFGNTYLQEAAPWKIWKENPDSEQVKKDLLAGLQIVTILSVLLEPFIPFTSVRLRKMLNLPAVQRGDLASLIAKLEQGTAVIDAGHQIGEPAILFAKIHDRKDHSRLAIIDAQRAKLAAVLEAEKANERPEIKPEIQFDDFTKLDLRTGTIIEAEKMPKAKKLLKLTVDIGTEKRTVVSGIAEYFDAEKIIGQKVVLLANLAPRKLRGVLSQGMILMAENAQGVLMFVSAPKEMEDGFVVR